MADSVFTKIIRGELPAYKVYEDDKVLAFLDLHPETPGHLLVAPKLQVDKFYDLPDADYAALFAAVKKVAAHMEQVLGQRILLKIIGVDVPHVHVHLFPVDPGRPATAEPPQADANELAKMAERLRFDS